MLDSAGVRAAGDASYGELAALVAEQAAQLAPTNASWADPIEAQFGILRTFTMANSDHPSHTALARRLHAYLRWRNANARDPRVLDAQRRERARVRSEKGHRWGRPQPRAA